jgi:hypothetical protein
MRVLSARRVGVRMHDAEIARPSICTLASRARTSSKASTSRSRPARCTPSWGRTAPARARWRKCWRAARTMTSHRRLGDLRGPDLLALPRGARARGPVSRLPVPGRNPRREQRLPAEGRAQCQAQASRRAEVDAYEFLTLIAEDEAHAHERVLPDARRQRRLLRRREEAQRDPADAGARAASSPSWTRPIRASTSMRSRSCPTA